MCPWQRPEATPAPARPASWSGSSRGGRVDGGCVAELKVNDTKFDVAPLFDDVMTPSQRARHACEGARDARWRKAGELIDGFTFYFLFVMIDWKQASEGFRKVRSCDVKVFNNKNKNDNCDAFLCL